jgi:chemotaxis protein CheX
MDIRFINPFVAVVKKVFKTMVATEVMIGKPSINMPDQVPTADVSAVIGLSGDAAGCVVLSLPTSTATQAATKFSGLELKPEDPDFSDALGELANMVAGQAKAQFEGLNVSISLPSVIIGKEHVVSQSRHRPRLSIPCESQLGKFWVEVAMVVNNSGAENQAAGAVAAAGP